MISMNSHDMQVLTITPGLELELLITRSAIEGQSSVYHSVFIHNTDHNRMVLEIVYVQISQVSLRIFDTSIWIVRQTVKG